MEMIPASSRGNERARGAFGLLVLLLGLQLTAGCGPQERTAVSADRPFRPALRQGFTQGRKPPQMTVNAVLDEANKDFSYRGVQIHPKLVNEFQCWISDLNPVTIVVDVAAASDSNEYSESTYKKGKYFTTKLDDEKTEYGYTRAHTAGDGIHVLKTRESGQGSGVFKQELWVRFEIGSGYDSDGNRCDQLLMRLVRAKGLPSER